MKFTDLKVKLDKRASAWKDKDLIDTYVVSESSQYLDVEKSLVDTRWVICCPVTHWFTKKIENKVVSFSLGSVNKFIKDNTIVIVEGFDCTPVKVHYYGDRYGIAFQII